MLKPTATAGPRSRAGRNRKGGGSAPAAAKGAKLHHTTLKSERVHRRKKMRTRLSGQPITPSPGAAVTGWRERGRARPDRLATWSLPPDGSSGPLFCTTCHPFDPVCARSNPRRLVWTTCTAGIFPFMKPAPSGSNARQKHGFLGVGQPLENRTRSVTEQAWWTLCDRDLVPLLENQRLPGNPSFFAATR